ncbi:MAG TPA: transcriptional regulator NanR [Hyphomonadaceae bacterium]|jgi:GntR family transcriptional repressor for pyruvate dehydrogenase complex
MIGIPAPIGVVRRRRLYEEIAGRLEAMIHEGQYLPGDQLPSERELMKQFGVGRPAVREALFALQKMGLVAINSGERARVTQPTPKVVFESLAGSARHLLAAPDGVRHFQEARVFFETGLARYAAAHATEADLAELKRALDANRLALDNLYAFERTDVAFHYVLAVIPRNPIFTAIHEAIAAWLTEQRTITLRTPGQKFVACRAHEKIYDAIAARDPDRAERVMREHLDQVTETYWHTQEEEHGRIRRHGGLPAEARNVRPVSQAHRRKRARLGAR